MCSDVVPNMQETLIKWAEHVFRHMFQSDVAVGAFMPPHQAEQNIPFPMVFRCSDQPGKRFIFQGCALAATRTYTFKTICLYELKTNVGKRRARFRSSTRTRARALLPGKISHRTNAHPSTSARMH